MRQDPKQAGGGSITSHLLRAPQDVRKKDSEPSIQLTRLRGKVDSHGLFETNSGQSGNRWLSLPRQSAKTRVRHAASMRSLTAKRQEHPSSD